MPDTQTSRLVSRDLKSYPVTSIQKWKEWAYTDGSYHIHLGKRAIGAGDYHPQKERPSYVQPNRTGITYTIVRAELAAIAAAILRGHPHIATDSLYSLHQIRKQTLYPELHREEGSDVLGLASSRASNQYCRKGCRLGQR
eukprot:1139084-Pelagomonas_calceolata.AAC.3